MKMVFYIYSKCIKRKKLYYFMKYRIIITNFNQKYNYMKRNSFNKLYSDYKIRNKKYENLKNNYLMNESQFYPFTPRLSFNGHFFNPNKIFPSVNNYGKKYYYSNNGFPFYKGMNDLKRCNYSQKKLIKDDRNNEKNKNYSYLYRLKTINKRNFNSYKNQKVVSSITSRINKNINDQISQYINNYELLKVHNFLNKTNPNISKKSNGKQNFFQSKESKSKSKNQNKNNKINHKLLCNINKSLNPSTYGGLELAKTNYTIHPKNSNNNFQNGNNVFSNVNSVSSRVNETTNNNTHYLNGIKIISGANECYYDFYDGNKNINNEQRTELSLQSLSDSKMLELASQYANEEDNSSENFQMNNILHSKKKYRNKINQ